MELELFMLSSGEKMHYRYPNGDEVYIAEAVYICRKYEGDLKVQLEEASEQRFFDLANLPDRISPMNIEVIERLKAHQVSKIDISLEVVDCIVFWTKNPEPMLERLDKLAAFVDVYAKNKKNFAVSIKN